MRLMNPHDSSKLLKTTIGSVRGDEAKYSDKSKDMFENHFYEEGVSKYIDNSIGSSLPQVADEVMSVDGGNI